MRALLDELVAFVGFSEEDQLRLSALHQTLSPQFPVIAADVYQAVQANPTTAEVLADTGLDGQFCTTLIEWMSVGLLGPWDERFDENRSRIGRRHLGVGLPLAYVVAAMTIIRTAYVEYIAELYPPAEAFRLMLSVNKLLDLELAVMQHADQLDSNEIATARERRARSEQLVAIQTLSSGLAHELRNPLNSANLQLEVLERRLRRHPTDPSLAEPCALAVHEIARLSALVDDFLAFAQPPALAAGVEDVVAVVAGAIEPERAVAERRGVVLALLATPLVIQGWIDPAKLHQIVHNLVRNAIEAVAPGGHVDVRVTADGDHVHVCVADDGPGMPERVRARMFEPFFSTKDSGTGLGMSIVHSLVSMHRGTIDVASTPEGTSIEIELPRAAWPLQSMQV